MIDLHKVMKNKKSSSVEKTVLSLPSPGPDLQLAQNKPSAHKSIQQREVCCNEALQEFELVNFHYNSNCDPIYTLYNLTFSLPLTS